MARKITFYFFLSVVLLAPLPFASNRPWSWSVLSALIGVLMILEGVTVNDRPEVVRRFLIRMAPGLILMAIVVSWILFQTMTNIPAGLAHPLWLETTALIGLPATPTITLDPVATRASLMRLLAYCGVFWIAARFCRDPEKAAVALKAFVVASAIYALYGLIVFFADLKTILWFDKWAYLDDLTSTFVNRNNYATYAGLGVVAGLALTFEQIGKRLRGYATNRDSILISLEWALSEAWLPLSGILLTGTALLLTHSRGGFLSTCLALFVLLVALSYTKILPKKIHYAVTSIVVLGSTFAFTMSGDLLIKRMESATLQQSKRDELYGLVIDAIAANPILGTGYGTFQQAFSPYKTREIGLWIWDKAHNSYLELAMELGIPATVVVVVVFLWLCGVFLHGLIRRRQHKVYAAIGLSATVLVAAHAMVDFSLQIPGLTVSYALLIGLAWAQSWSSREPVD